MAKVRIEGSVPVIVLKEGEMFVAYSPVLDLSTAGHTFEEASKNFEEAMWIFFEECLRHKTLDRALESLGWERPSSRSHDWHPPIVVGQERVTLRVPATA